MDTVNKMSQEIMDKIEVAARAEEIYEPKYGGKDHSGYDTMMKYEINYERSECFEKGAIFGYHLRDEEVDELNRDFSSITGTLDEVIIQLQQKDRRIKELEDLVTFLRSVKSEYEADLIRKAQVSDTKKQSK